MTLKPEGLFIYNNEWRFNHNVEFNRKDWKVRTLQYRACGYQALTIVKLIQATTDIKKKQIYNLMTNFVKRTGTPFVKSTAGDMDEFYHQKELRHIGRINESLGEYTNNRPVFGGDYRIFLGITAEEEKLLKVLRGMK